MTTELSLEKFSPARADLELIANDAEQALDLDLTDKKQLETFKGHKKELQQARIEITRTAKGMREEALAFQKEVIRQEKEYVGIISGVEEQLDEKMTAHKEAQIREERLAELPERTKMLDEIGDKVDVDDDILLSMDHDAFVAYLNERKSAHLDKLMAVQREREAEEARQKELKEAEERAAERAKEEAETAAREEAERKEREQKEAVEKAEREKREAEEALQREREEAERKKKEEEERKVEEARQEEERKKKEAEDEKYQAWLVGNGRTEQTANEYYLKSDGKTVELYKLVDTFTFE